MASVRCEAHWLPASLKYPPSTVTVARQQRGSANIFQRKLAAVQCRAELLSIFKNAHQQGGKPRAVPRAKIPAPSLSAPAARGGGGVVMAAGGHGPSAAPATPTSAPQSRHSDLSRHASSRMRPSALSSALVAAACSASASCTAARDACRHRAVTAVRERGTSMRSPRHSASFRFDDSAQ